MPEFPVYNAPWLKDQSDPANWIVPAMKLGIEAKQRQDRNNLDMQYLALEARKMDMQQKLEEVKIRSETLKADQQEQEAEDYEKAFPILQQWRNGNLDAQL